MKQSKYICKWLVNVININATRNIQQKGKGTEIAVTFWRITRFRVLITQRLSVKTRSGDVRRRRGFAMRSGAAIIESRLEVLIAKALMCRDTRGSGWKCTLASRWQRGLSVLHFAFENRTSVRGMQQLAPIHSQRCVRVSACRENTEGNIVSYGLARTRLCFHVARLPLDEARYNDNSVATEALLGWYTRSWSELLILRGSNTKRLRFRGLLGYAQARAFHHALA